MIERLTSLFKNKLEKDSGKFVQSGEIVEQFFTLTKQYFTKLELKINELHSELNAIQKRNDEYKALLNDIPDAPERPISTVGSTEIETIC